MGDVGQIPVKAFKRRGKTLAAKLTDDEVAILTSLVNQLVELLQDTAPSEEADKTAAAGDDPFAMWEADLSDEPDEPETSSDPVVQRLFPTAYPHDPAAASDFRRFTERDQRQRKLRDAQQVLTDLVAAKGGAESLKVASSAVTAWLKTLTALRLSVAARLGITDSDSAAELEELTEDDPRAFMYSVYEWLGFAQESMLASL